METTIKLETKTKEKLDTLKLSKRESYNEVIERMINECRNLTTDEGSLKETIDILSDPETLQDIAQALRNFEKGKYVELK
ncbi:MAG: antitoxin VapB family protein [Nanoarchaeota archaeon]